MKSISSNYHIIFVGRGYVPDSCVVWGIEWAFEKGKYKKKADAYETVTGKVDLTSSGNAYIVVEGMPEDIFIPNSKLITLLSNGDKKNHQPKYSYNT